jgi:GNAT superfamily N-acetyltransferase
MTRFERDTWKVSPGRGLTLFETEFGRVAIAICYDSEFPEICRAAARQGAVILVVPSYTDDRQGFLRVRYCAQARTIENQLFVVHSGTVGSLPAVPAISLNYGQASILSPSDFSMARDGVIAEGQPNQEAVVIGDIDLKALRKLRSRGTVLPLRDSRNSAELVAETTVVSSIESAKSAPATRRRRVQVRNTQRSDFAGIREMARLIYPDIERWSDEQLGRHLELFPQGQFVAVDTVSGMVLGTASGLILNWDRYASNMDWSTLTDQGLYTNHDPVEGATLFAADIMVRPGNQGGGIGKRLHERARFGLARQIGMRRIIAGSRLSGYQRYAKKMPAAEYAIEVVNGRLNDPVLSFHLALGFHVLDVVENYFGEDPESQGWAAVIEWLNPDVADDADYGQGDPRFRPTASQA